MTALIQPEGITIRTELRCGDLGKIIALHGLMYEAEPGFGLPFEAYVAKTIAEYVLDNASRGCVWLAEHDDTLVGCVAIAERDGNVGQLRWVLVHDRLRGIGLGRRLIAAAVDYCRERGLEKVMLETTDGLEASRMLYQQMGFKTVWQGMTNLWAGERVFIKMEKMLF